jgi:hypothetical protein
MESVNIAEPKRTRSGRKEKNISIEYARHNDALDVQKPQEARSPCHQESSYVRTQGIVQRLHASPEGCTMPVDPWKASVLPNPQK